jgi:hypothetical protein
MLSSALGLVHFLHIRVPCSDMCGSNSIKIRVERPISWRDIKTGPNNLHPIAACRWKK